LDGAARAEQRSTKSCLDDTNTIDRKQYLLPPHLDQDIVVVARRKLGSTPSSLQRFPALSWNERVNKIGGAVTP
jgi:hypothetical protein